MLASVDHSVTLRSAGLSTLCAVFAGLGVWGFQENLLMPSEMARRSYDLELRTDGPHWCRSISRELRLY